ncbi:hypothetical protein [Candidatus Anaplasma sp. TIGMIC]|uniref:hypothetical protein n=1 Tax=Candidatus Anaplasma sp. TIGMIC TaxID=3020713 RepID=UPI00232F83A4|nr:hypothetical protein [Candidatus Anaplasma sp. TIGMIC]MDB1135171.1 hypothetical protein [Candidatus Anaplasma sp. TIGMIC]
MLIARRVPPHRRVRSATRRNDLKKHVANTTRNSGRNKRNIASLTARVSILHDFASFIGKLIDGMGVVTNKNAVSAPVNTENNINAGVAVDAQGCDDYASCHYIICGEEAKNTEFFSPYCTTHSVTCTYTSPQSDNTQSQMYERTAKESMCLDQCNSPSYKPKSSESRPLWPTYASYCSILYIWFPSSSEHATDNYCVKYSKHSPLETVTSVEGGGIYSPTASLIVDSSLRNTICCLVIDTHSKSLGALPSVVT